MVILLYLLICKFKIISLTDEGTGMYFQKNEKDSHLQIAKSPLAKEIFDIDGIKSIA